MPQLRGNEAGNPALPCGAASHTLVVLLGQPPSLDPGNSDLFKLGIAQLEQILGSLSRLPSFTCQGSCAFAVKPVGANCVQKAGEELRQCWGRMGCWAAALCAHPVQAWEMSGEEREQHSLRHAI